MPSGGGSDSARTLRPSAGGATSALSPPDGAGTGPATAALQRAAQSVGLRPHWRQQARVEGLVSLWACELTDDTGEPVPNGYGMGKGPRGEARLRALSEALERFLTGPPSLDVAAVRFATAGALADGLLAEEASAPLLRQAPDSELACHTYQSLHPGRDDADIPVYLGAPWYPGQDGQVHRDRVGDRTDYHALSRYSVNSGYGLAPTVDQATVHALLETVERDACSLLTIRTLISGQQATVLDPCTLPGDLAVLHARVQREVDAPIHLLDATSDLGIPTVLAYCTPRGRRPWLRGHAASLTPRDAVTRALTELLESAVVHRDALARPVPLTLLEPYPALHRCARFDLTGPLRRARTVPFPDGPSPAGPSADPGAQLGELLARLAAGGFTAYRRHVAELPGEVSAVHTVVPGLERFFAVVKGALVVPGRRGRSLPARAP